MGSIKEQDTVPSRTDEEIRSLALDLYKGNIFTDRHIAHTEMDRMLGMVFMPLALGATSDCSKEYIESIGLVYEYYSKAGPTCINGYPTFFSCALLNKEDAAKLFDYALEISKKLEDFEKKT